MLEQSAERLSFNVTRCRYAEMYRALGLADLGSSLSCQRDFSLVEGFNPAIGLTRTQTLMEGASHCDFRFVAPGPDEPDRAPPDRERPRVRFKSSAPICRMSSLHHPLAGDGRTLAEDES